MTLKDIAFKHEDLTLKAWALDSLLLAVKEALQSGNYAYPAFEGAFHQLIETAMAVSDGARELTEELFRLLEEET